MVLTILVSWATTTRYYYKLGDWKRQKFIVSEFCRLGVQIQGLGQAKGLGEEPSLFFQLPAATSIRGVVAARLQSQLLSSHGLPIPTAHVLSRPGFPFVCVALFTPLALLSLCPCPDFPLGVRTPSMAGQGPP